MRRNIILISIAFITILLLLITSNIIIIAEKLGQLTHTGIYGEIFLYAVVGLLLFFFIVRPLWKLYRMPQVPSMQTDDTMDKYTLRRLGSELADAFQYIPDASVRMRKQQDFVYKLRHSHEVKEIRECVEKEVQVRLHGDQEIGVKGIDSQIKEWAKTVFAVTALSPNSKLDSISALVLNFTMMKNMIQATGFRPNNLQMWRLYIRILLTSLLSYAVSEALIDIGDVKPLGFIEDMDFSDADESIDIDAGADADADSFSFVRVLGKLGIPGAVVGPVLDGITNALMTLRVGYVTRSYLMEGQNVFFNRKRCKEIKREALTNSIKELPTVLIEGSKGMGKSVGNVISWYTNHLRCN